MHVIIYPIIWRIAGAILKASAIIPNIEITIWIAGTLPTLSKPLVPSAGVVWYDFYHQLYTYTVKTYCAICAKTSHTL